MPLRSLSISNIAWDKADDLLVSKLLRAEGISSIDIAPSKYFESYESTKPSDAFALKGWWEDRDIRIVGFQSLMFRRPNLNIFANAEIQTAMLKHLSGVANLASNLGVERLVFGSPRNRDASGLERSEAERRAIKFFSELGRRGEDNNVIFCLEPNPTRYGCNFMRDMNEAATVVRAVGSPYIKLQFDLGSCEVNGENPVEAAREYAALIGHVHLSTVDLLPINKSSFESRTLLEAISHLNRSPYLTIEQLPFGASAKEELAALSSSIAFANAFACVNKK